MTNRIVSPTRNARVFLGDDGTPIEAPEGWTLLPPGDAGLTRRVKALGPTWTIVERRGRKVFGRGLLAPSDHIDGARRALDVERADPSYARKLEAGRERRARAEVAYADDFAAEVRAFLAFSEPYFDLGLRVSVAVAAHATPVGSGTVARTRRIPIEERAEAAVIAWLRHQTTAYDDMDIPRVPGLRREVRRELAARSRKLIESHRRSAHAATDCPLCVAQSPRPKPTTPVVAGPRAGLKRWTDE